MSRARSAVGAVVGCAGLVAVIAATIDLTGGDAAAPSRLVVSGGTPAAGAPITASPATGPKSPGRPAAAPTPQDRFADWASGMAAKTGVPARALVAYAAAQTAIARTDPACGLSWPTLAGIGYVESDNGGGGGGLLADGRPLQEIVGVALTGAGAVAAVPDTDGGALDGDPAVDRAVGPLQFLPSTWKTWAADGDGDGAEDPQDIDDAALAAAGYLCAAGDLLTADGWTAAVLSYNHSDDYLRAVFAASDAYASRSTD